MSRYQHNVIVRAENFRKVKKSYSLIFDRGGQSFIIGYLYEVTT